MPKRPTNLGRAVREPVQVYLAGEDRALLARLAAETGFSMAEILRRGVRSFAREQEAPSPMRRFMEDAVAAEWPEGEPMAERHDAFLADDDAARRRKPK